MALEQAFIINDINLQIDPENISIQTEDLVYSFKTLRTSHSTKIPSGHGQNLIQVKIPFLDSHILSLHRLMIELKQSPFCSIENMFIRQTLHSDWPLSQTMAFTVTGVNLIPYPGTSNAYILHFEMMSFNYLPYMHNWLYREEWVTEWITAEAGKATPYSVKATIGWNIDDDGNKTTPRKVVVAEQQADSNNAVLEWDALLNEYAKNNQLSLEDMEILHKGDVFDLMPLPSRMSQANYVQYANDSLIYKRYINLLQRDALKANFNIDIEKFLNYDWKAKNSVLGEMLFARINDSSAPDTNAHVQSLHVVTLPISLEAYQEEWNKLQMYIINEMLSFKRNTLLFFANYKSVQLPQGVATYMQKTLAKAKKDITSQGNDDKGQWIYSKDRTRKLAVRRGLSEPLGLYIPYEGISTDVTFETLSNHINSGIQWRDNSKIYSDNEHSARYHKGIDVSVGGVLNQSFIYAVKDGVVKTIVQYNSERQALLSRWKCIYFEDGEAKVKSITNSTHLTSKFYETINVAFPNSTEWQSLPVGTIVPAVDRTFYFYVDYGDAGQYIVLSHNNGNEISKYMHLSSILVSVGDSVKAGQAIAIMGNTAPFDTSFMIEEAGRVDTGNLTPLSERTTQLKTHLHFSYFEKQSFYAEREPSDNKDAQVEPSGETGYTLVDPVPTWKWAASQGYTNIIKSNSTGKEVNSDSIKSTINRNDDLSTEDKASLTEMLDFMYTNGYKYYDKQSDITNVWLHPWRVTIEQANPVDIGIEEISVQDNSVLTNLSCGFRHIVSNIPILGQEFPTHQHLGSMEPYYTLEFHLLDDTGTLEGIGTRGGVLSAIKQLLQQNAREFRDIPDSWCLATDNFFTRLLGSFRASDIKVQQTGSSSEPNPGNNILEDYVLQRRTMITRASMETIEGNPGLSRMVWDIQETNPYAEESLEINAPSLMDKDEARKKILNAIYYLEFKPEYKDNILKVFLAQHFGANTSVSDNADFGVFEIPRGAILDTGNIPGTAQFGKEIGFLSYDKGFFIDGMGEEPYRELYKKIYNLTDEEVALLNDNAAPGELAYVLRDDKQVLRDFFALNDIPYEEYTIVTSDLNAQKEYANFVIIKESEAQISDYQNTWTNTGTVFDIKQFLNFSAENLHMGEVNLSKIYDVCIVLQKIIDSADMYIAEGTDELLDAEGESSNKKGVLGTPLDKASVQKELYDLPIEPRLFRSFQEYLKRTASLFYFPTLNNLGIGVSPEEMFGTKDTSLSDYTVVSEILEANSNWIEFSTPANIAQKIQADAYGWTDGLYNLFVDILGKPIDLVFEEILSLSNAIRNQGRYIGAKADGNEATQKMRFAHIMGENAHAINHNIVSFYTEQLPLYTMVLKEEAQNLISESILGDVIGAVKGWGGLPAIANTKEKLNEILESGGYFGAHPWFETVPFFLNPVDMDKDVIDLTFDEMGNPTQAQAPYWISVVENMPSLMQSVIFGLGLSNEEWFKYAGLNFPGSPIKWAVDNGVEMAKVRYFKELLATLADQSLQDPEILRAFGLENLHYIVRDNIVKGKEAYPDLKLPAHPYYGDSYSTYPDFYMWNMYEDGNVYDSETRRQVRDGMYTVLENAYKSINKLTEGETGSNIYTPSRSKAILDPSIDDPISLNIKFNAEGKEGMATPFYPDSINDSSIERFYSNMETQGGGIDIADLKSKKVPGVRVSNTEGYYGSGAGVQYPSKMSADQYAALKEKVNSLEDMFGSRAGYLKQAELPDSINKRLNGTPLSRDSQPSHKFDLESLKQLAVNSSYDIFSEKRRLARAYPTFKLYFIEEDEWENRLLNFDDFYSYNAIKDFTVTSSRKIAADVAMVTLQNISGVLDGTKRDAVTDLDYFSSKMKGDSYGGQASKAGTLEEQPFGALVLRTGLNVQLRMGYSNDPNNLAVMINGRVVDVQWNQQGDLAQIMIQSFGSELNQVLKGTEEGAGTIFYTTHQLLSSLMLEPELVHFGRWEIGQLFQDSEAKDAAFDFRDYSKDTYMGRFQHSSDAMKWFFNHHFVMYGLAIGGIALASRVPFIKNLFTRSAISGATRIPFVGSFLEKLGVKGLTKAGAYIAEGELLLEKAVVEQVERQVIRNGTSNAVKIITKDTALTDAQAVEIIAERLGYLAQRIVPLIEEEIKAGKFASGTMAKIVAQVEAAIGKNLEKELIPLLKANNGTGTVTIEQVTKALVETENIYIKELFKAGWWSNPLGTNTGIDMISDIGMRPLNNILSKSFTNVPKIIGGAAAAGLALDGLEMTGLPHSIYENTVGRIVKYFSASQSLIKLSPQDDNIYPPHPKDYMKLDKPFAADLKQWLLTVGLNAIASTDMSKLVSHYFTDNSPYDKRVSAEVCQYVIDNSYIWDMFHEMALRHPGWVYAVRPYGNKFRYTMFFGVPSQRYWAVPADNLFIERMNKLSSFLENDDLTPSEMKSLYGDRLGAMTIDDIEEGLEEIAWSYTNDFIYVDQSNIVTGTKTVDANDTKGAGSKKSKTINVYGPTVEEQMMKVYNEKLKSLHKLTYAGKALSEYLKGLNLRFKPFRKYHSISSNTDLVWNGLLSSENASYNAVDVTYMAPLDDEENVGIPVGNAIVKAHAFMPDSSMRVKPLPLYSNCRDYDMAMRYGMGELAFTLRDMYRGEIIVMGNPRIMPWDICILQDTYNSMVGPIEVEQVVHTMSHETGYITEIKPSAVVFTNETSSWPILEAMKIACLAVRNIETNYIGDTHDQLGDAVDVAEWIVGNGPGNDKKEYSEYAMRKMQSIFGVNNTELTTNEEDLNKMIFGAEAPTEEQMNELNKAGDKAEEYVDTTLNTLGYISLATGFSIQVGTSIGALYLRRKGIIGAKTGRMAMFGGFGASVIGVGGRVIANQAARLDIPDLMYLLGGNLLLLQCLKGDSMVVVPLMKNGYPIVSGLNMHDPAMTWKNLLGDIGRYADDVLGGTQDLLNLWQIYGTYAWKHLPEWNSLKTDIDGAVNPVNVGGTL